TYFGKTDFAEIYSALEPTEENPKIPAEAEARFKASPEYQRYVVLPLNQGPAGPGRNMAAQPAHEVVQPKRGDPFRQFNILCSRYLQLLFNDRGNLLILLLQAPIIAVILFFLTAGSTFTATSVVNCPHGIYESAGINRSVFSGTDSIDDCQNVLNALQNPSQQNPITQVKLQALLQQHNGDIEATLQPFIQPDAGGDAQKILFIMAFAAVMFGCINGAREIVKEEPIYRRERAVNLGIAPYLFSKICILGALCFVQSLVLVIIVDQKAAFVAHGVLLPSAFVEIYISMFLTSIAGLMLGLTVSALAPNNDRATSFIPIILIPQVIFSGIIFSLNNPFMQFLGSFFAARWAMAAMGSTVGIHGLFVQPDGSTAGEDFSYQGTLFSTHSAASAAGHLLLCWFALILMSVLLGFATTYFLKRKDARK
ncbi:MAG: ABC transporter permease, partial [Ktedonobacteraceae bacterium]